MLERYTILLLLLLIGQAVSDTVVYVDPRSECLHSCGSETRPHASIKAALESIKHSNVAGIDIQYGFDDTTHSYFDYPSILLAPGLYTGVDNKGLSIRSPVNIRGTDDQSQQRPTIDCQGRGYGLVISNTVHFSLSGIDIVNCNGNMGGALHIVNTTSATISNALFYGNRASVGSSIYVSSSYVDLVSVSHSNNNNNTLFVDQLATVYIYGNQFTCNSSIECDHSSTVIVGKEHQPKTIRAKCSGSCSIIHQGSQSDPCERWKVIDKCQSTPSILFDSLLNNTATPSQSDCLSHPREYSCSFDGWILERPGQEKTPVPYPEILNYKDQCSSTASLSSFIKPKKSGAYIFRLLGKNLAMKLSINSNSIIEIPEAADIDSVRRVSLSSSHVNSIKIEFSSNSLSQKNLSLLWRHEDDSNFALVDGLFSNNESLSSNDTFGKLLGNQYLFTLPGVSILTHGVDYLTENSMSSPIFSAGYCKEYSLVHNIRRNLVYTVPISFEAHLTPQCTFDMTSKTYDSSSEISSEKSKDSSVSAGFEAGGSYEGFGGSVKASFSEEESVKVAMNQLNQRDGKLVSSQIECVTSKISLKEIHFHPQFLQDLSLVFDDESMSHVVLKYGNLYHKWATMGGRLTQMTTVDNTFIQNSNSKDVSKLSKASMGATIKTPIFSSSGEVSGSSDNKFTSEQQKSFRDNSDSSTIITHGGNTNFIGSPDSSTNPYAKWASSVDILAAPIHKEYGFILDLIPETWMSRDGSKSIKSLWRAAELKVIGKDIPVGETPYIFWFTQTEVPWYNYNLSCSCLDKSGNTIMLSAYIPRESSHTQYDFAFNGPLDIVEILGCNFTDSTGDGFGLGFTILLVDVLQSNSFLIVENTGDIPVHYTHVPLTTPINDYTVIIPRLEFSNPEMIFPPMLSYVLRGTIGSVMGDVGVTYRPGGMIVFRIPIDPLSFGDLVSIELISRPIYMDKDSVYSIDADSFFMYSTLPTTDGSPVKTKVYTPNFPSLHITPAKPLVIKLLYNQFVQQ
eukprot:gene7385-8608_t